MVLQRRAEREAKLKKLHQDKDGGEAAASPRPSSRGPAKPASATAEVAVADPEDKRRAMRVALSQRVKEDLSSSVGHGPSGASSSTVAAAAVATASAPAAASTSSAVTDSQGDMRHKLELERKRRTEVEDMFANLNPDEIAKTEFSFKEK